MRIILDCIINKMKKESPWLSNIPNEQYLSNYIPSQCGLNASNGLCGEVVATCEPLGNLGISLMEHSGKVFLGESLFFQNLTQSLCYAKRQVEFGLLFGWYCCKVITEKFILYHNDYISNVALSISVNIFFSMVIIQNKIDINNWLARYYS